MGPARATILWLSWPGKNKGVPQSLSSCLASSPFFYTYERHFLLQAVNKNLVLSTHLRLRSILETMRTRYVEGRQAGMSHVKVSVKLKLLQTGKLWQRGDLNLSRSHSQWERYTQGSSVPRYSCVCLCAPSAFGTYKRRSPPGIC